MFTADLRFHCKLSVFLGRLCGLQLGVHRLILNLGILLPKDGHRLLDGQLLHVGRALRVEIRLLCQPFHIGAGLLVAGLQLLHLLFGVGERSFKLTELELKRSWVDLEQNGPRLNGLVRLDWYRRHLAGYVRSYLDDASGSR